MESVLHQFSRWLLASPTSSTPTPTSNEPHDFADPLPLPPMLDFVADSITEFVTHSAR